ncbi:MAG: Ig-like domain-containing protein [Verrucomicrobia bacterium]|nr:Ig-like domain-containing protein [Verrucomicrobiota bacterium]
MQLLLRRWLRPGLPLLGLALSVGSTFAQPTYTAGFLNLARPEPPGTLLSHPIANGSERIGRTTSINYLNGWIIVGAESPGSREGSDLVARVYDISDPTNPIRRYPIDFGLVYPNNRWIQGNFGWDAHGTAKYGNMVVPSIMRVNTFGGAVELGGTGDVPALTALPLGYSRPSMAGPWSASMQWYGSTSETFTITRASTPGGFVAFQTVASFDHVGPYGGGDWHPMFFGDLLIYARSGAVGSNGIVVYRLQYNDFDNPATRSITPQLVGTLAGGFAGYWPNLFSDGSGLYVIGSTSDILVGADITQAAHPQGSGEIRLAASLAVPNFTNASYPVYQDNFGFIHNRKVDMTRFLAGDPNPIVLALDENATQVNTSQISLPLGNLWLTGGYPIGTTNQGLGVWVHQQLPDQTRPRVAYHIPQAGRTNYPRHAPLSFLIHEHTRGGALRNGIDFAVRPVLPDNSLGSAVSGFLIQDFAGVMTFTPDPPLAGATTYQVDFFSDLPAGIGFIDAAGNAIEPHSFRFSTGGVINATPPPVLTAVTASNYQPQPGVLTTVTATATGQGALQYRFNFNGTWTDWSNDNFASFAYAGAGRPRVLVQVRDANGNLATGALNLLVLTPPPAGPRPTQSAPLAVGDDPAGRRVWMVNPDTNTVAVLDAVSGDRLFEHAVGQNPRSVARDAAGRYWITCQASDEIRVLNADGTLFANLSVPYGSGPFAAAPSPDGLQMFVSLTGSGQLRRYSTTNVFQPPVVRSALPTARAMAVSANGQRVFLTRFISTELEAEINEYAGTSNDLAYVRTFRLASSNTVDGGDRASGVPNYLASIALSPDGTRAAVVSKQDNIQRGPRFGVADLTHETTVRAVVSILDLVNNVELPNSRRDFDNSDSPSFVAYTPLGDSLLVTLQGNNRLVGLDALGLVPTTAQVVAGSMDVSPAVITLSAQTGRAPQGLLLDPVSNRLFVQDFLGRTATVRNAAPLLLENRTTLPLVQTASTVGVELLPLTVLEGKRIFYNAADPRMSADGYVSCASCHVDGGSDGRVWDFTGRGEGLRRTTDLRGRTGRGHGNVHWSANFDEIQDFEHDMRGPFGGTGFLPLTATEFAAQHPSPATGKAGLSAELDSLAAYVASLTPATTPRSPQRNADGTYTAAALRGRNVFVAQACTACHSGNSLTSSPLGPVATAPLVNVGTQSLVSGQRLGALLTGIDVPTLHGLHATRLYLHHGLAETLPDVFAYAGGTLLLPGAAQLIFQPPTPPAQPAVQVGADNPAEGGGGLFRGAIGGSAAFLGEDPGAAEPPGLRFTAVDGGSGGAGRLALRYVRQYGPGTVQVRVNGVSQVLNLQRQYPDNSYQISGWRWLYLDVTLLPGPNNVLEIRRGNADVVFNALLVSNAADLAAAEPHRRVLALAAGDRSDLFAYVGQLDGRDDAGVPFAPPAPPAPTAPSIVANPAGRTIAVGNAFSLTVAVGGTGPFTYQWYRGATPVGPNAPTFAIASAALGDGGAYTVQISNAQGQVVSGVANVVVNPALAVTTAALPEAIVGIFYDVQLAASGGVDTRTWSLANGVLPVGLTLSAGGRLSGTPVAPARANLNLRVADTSGAATRLVGLNVRPVAGFVTDPDLVLHYTFDEGTGLRVWDAAPNGQNHATDLGTASWSPNGRFGGAYGSDNLVSAVSAIFPSNQSDLNFNPRADAFTISVWVRTSYNGGYATIVSKDRIGEPFDVQYRLWTTNTPTNVQVVAGNQGSPNLAANAPALNDGQWHLLTFVNYLDNGTWRTRLYFDNGTTFVQGLSGAGPLVGDLMCVGDTTRRFNPWIGQLDDLRIYRRALSQAEVAALYSPAPPETFASWIDNLPTPPPAGLRGANDDPDGDGVPNLAEFGLGGDPTSAASAPRPQLARAGGLLTLSYPRARAGLTYVVETTTDLVAGPWTTEGVTQDMTTPVGQTATASVPDGGARRFLRLRIVQP